MSFVVTPFGRSGMSSTIIKYPDLTNVIVVVVDVNPEVSHLMMELSVSKILTSKLSLSPGTEGFSTPSI